ncbi:MAG: virulence RhuM family protein [Candidatus Gracilibacteria bacterium]|jgi:hypothetical protein
MENNSQILLYQTADGSTKIEVKLENETVWLSQKQMSELFQKDTRTVSEHIGNLFKEGELDTNSTIRKFRIVQKEGGREIERAIDFYNLDVIISVGYRIKSHRGTQFRIWATQQLREYIVKGFVMDDGRLSEGKTLMGINYFDELLERVRAIRASERNLYEKVKDIFATSIDYNPSAGQAKEFYATVQNKFHYAITGQTAAEIVVTRIDGKKENMGLTNWKGNKVKREDAEIAKNYMLEKELKQLYLLVEQFLSFAELQISLERPMYMADWKKKLNEFLKLNELKILEGKGKISHEEMEKVVKKEMQKYLDISEENPKLKGK